VKVSDMLCNEIMINDWKVFYNLEIKLGIQADVRHLLDRSSLLPRHTRAISACNSCHLSL
jgi:hypothetical protein